MSWDSVPEPEDRDDDLDPATHRFAIYSVALGVGAFASLYVFPFGCLVLGVPALTTGIHARREIAASKGSLTGDSMAVTGLMIGGAALLTGLLLLLMGAFST